MMNSLFNEWMEAKKAEAQATAKRREIEAQIAASLKIPDDWEGSYTMKDSGFKVLVKRSFTRKVDGEKLNSIAAENNLQECLSSLFRWKPEIDMKAWKSADKNITDTFAQAITTTPGKVTFKIEEEEK